MSSNSTLVPARVPARVSIRQPVSRAGYLDAAWWPRSLDLPAELPSLLDELRAAGHTFTRLTYDLGAWDTAPRRMVVDGCVVRLGGYATGDPLTVRLTDSWGRDRIDVLVIAPDTEPALAARILALAGASGNLLTPAQTVARANAPASG